MPMGRSTGTDENSHLRWNPIHRLRCRRGGSDLPSEGIKLERHAGQ
jgi:hypothetical protein